MQNLQDLCLNSLSLFPSQVPKFGTNSFYVNGYSVLGSNVIQFDTQP